MGTREEIEALLTAVNEEASVITLRLRDEEYRELEQILKVHPEAWPIGLADTFKLLKQRLSWEPIDRSLIPSFLIDFFDIKFKQDLDPMAMARSIGRDIHGSCAECECKC